MLSGFFVCWISLVTYVWSYYGFLPLIATLFTLHIVILRVLPKVLFDWDFVNTANIVTIVAHEAFTRNCPYIGGAMSFDGLTEDDFKNWLKTTVSKLTHLNRKIVRFGPEAFALYYFAPGLPAEEIGTIVPEVVTQKDYDEFVENAMSTRKHELGNPTWLAFFFPNYEGPDMIFLLVNHIMFDGAATRQLMSELMDNKAGVGPRNRIAELRSDLLFLYKSILQLPYALKFAKTLTSMKMPKESLLQPETESAMKTASAKRNITFNLDKDEALRRCRKAGITLNDFIVSAQVAAYHAIHAKRGIEIDSVPLGFNINMRFYPPPFRTGNELAVFFRQMPVKPASKELIETVKSSIMTFKKDNREAFMQYLLNIQMNVLSHSTNVKIARMTGTNCLVSSNIPGPEEEWRLMGKKLTNIWVEGINKSDLFVVSTCGPNLNITLCYSTGKTDVKIYEEFHAEIVKAFHELMGILE